MFMESNRITQKKASFTVEAVFVMTITIWILLGMCYLTLYVHDKTVVCSLLHNFIQIQTERGQTEKAAEMSSQLKEELETDLFISDIKWVKVEKEFLALRAEVSCQAEVHVPFIKMMLSSKWANTAKVSHPTLSAPEYLWDSLVAEEVVK